MNKFILSILTLLIIGCSSKEEKLVVPDVLPKFNVLVDKGDGFDGYILIRKINDPGAQMIINSKGDVVWYQLSDTAVFRPFYPAKNKYIALYSDTEIHEMSYEGDTLLKLEFGTNDFDKKLHHDIRYDEEGNIVVLTKEEIPMDLSSVGGNADDTVVTDGIIKMDRKGNEIWHWSLNQVIDLMDYPDIKNKKHDLGHANALYIDDDGHYLVSWRDFDQIWKINSNSGEVIWKYGGELIADKSKRFYKQHTICKNLDGDYMLFDNGHKKLRSTSRAVAFKVLNDSTFEQTLTIDLPDSLFSSKQGSVYQIETEKFLFSSPMNFYLAITNRSGEILWMAKSTEPFYRAEYIEQF